MSFYLLDTLAGALEKGPGRGVHLKLLAPFPSLLRSLACGTEESHAGAEMASSSCAASQGQE